MMYKITIIRFFSYCIASFFSLLVLGGFHVSAQGSVQELSETNTINFTNQEIKNAIRAIEQREDIKNKTIYTNISYVHILQLLERGCSNKSIQKAQDFLVLAQGILDKKYSKSLEADILLDTYAVYNLVADLNLKQVNQRSGDAFCTLKYAMNGLMKYTRNVNLEILQSSGIIHDFNGGDGQLYGVPIKIATLKKHNSQYLLAQQKAGNLLNVTIENPEFSQSLSFEEQKILHETQLLMKNMIADSMVSLKESGLFVQNDLDIISDNITFEYRSECNRFNGRYDIIQTIDHQGNLLGTETTGINFMINYCPNYFVIRDFPEIFSKIIIHELAHHFYYYHDDNIEAFEGICRSSLYDIKERCDQDDFVSDYAKTASVEDYAEHFMYWYLGGDIKSTPILQEKTAHFDKFIQ